MSSNVLPLIISISISLLIGMVIGYLYAKGKDKKDDLPIIPDTESDILKVRQTLMRKLELLRKDIGIDFIGLAFYDSVNSEIRWRLAVGTTNNRYKKIVIRLGKGIAGEVVQLNRTIKIENYPHDVLGDPIEYPILLVEHLKCAIAVPVTDDLRIYGVLLAGDREQRKFSQNDEDKLLNTGKELSRELAIANVYSQIRNEKSEQNAKQGKVYIHDSSFVRYLQKQQELLPMQKRGKITFEVLDQSIVGLPEYIQQVLITNMGKILSIINKKDYDSVKVSISREESNLLIESESNHPLPAEDVTLSEIYQRFGEIGGSIISYHEKNHLHLIIQIPIWIE